MQPAWDMWWLALLLCCSLASPALVTAGPALLWASNPVLPNDTALVYGSGLNSTSSVTWWDYSVKFGIPSNWSLSVYRFTLCSSGGQCSGPYLLNSAEVAWIDGDADVSLRRLFGRALAFHEGQCVPSSSPLGTAGTEVTLTSLGAPYKSYTFGSGDDGNVVAGCHDVRVTLPNGLPTGQYSVSVSNSLQTAGGFDPTTVSRDGDLLVVAVVAAKVWPGDASFNNTRVFDVRKDYGGNVSQAVAAANAVAGGAVVYLSAGSDIQMGDREYVALGSNVVLRGDSANSSRLVWANNTAAPTNPLVQAVNGSIKIEDIGFEVTSIYSKGLLALSNNANGSVVQRIAARLETSEKLGNALYVASNDVTISDSYIYVAGNLSFTYSYPYHYMLYANGAEHFRLLRIKWDTNSPGYAILGGQYFVWEGNQFNSYQGPSYSTTGGSGFNTLGYHTYSERVGFVRNCQTDSQDTHFMESWTGDGPGGAYFGGVASLNGTSLILASNASLASPIIGSVAVITNGQGAGQLGRIAGYLSNTSMILERELPIPLDPTNARVSITGYRGDIIISGNLFEQGSVVESYGMQMKSVWSYNTLHNMVMIPWQANDGPGGFNLHGRVYQGGVEPAYFNEINHNWLINCTGGITSITTTSPTFSGPFIRAMVVRHNVIQQQGLITVATNVSDALVEHNYVNSTTGGGPVMHSSGADHSIVQNNLANVTTGLPDPTVDITRPCAWVAPAPTPTPSYGQANHGRSGLWLTILRRSAFL